MRFRVTGTNHTTGARMTLEFDASSKAAAEHKARSQGMDVQHAAEIREGQPPEHHPISRRGEPAPVTGVHPVVKTLVVLALVALVAWFGWPYLRGVFGR